MIGLFEALWVAVRSIAATLGLVLLLLFVVLVTREISREARRHNRTVRVEVATTEGRNTASGIFREALEAAFTEFRRSITILETRLALRDGGLSYFTDCAHLLPAAEGIDIQVEVGPIRFGNLAHIISRYITVKEFVLRIRATPCSNSSHSVFATLSLNRNLWYTWRDKVAAAQKDSYCRRLVREVVWLTSRRSPSEAQFMGQWRQSELRLLEGLERLSAYLVSPGEVRVLEEAANLFAEARRRPWEYQADLLGAISLSLTQRQPRAVAERMQALLDQYGHLPHKRAVLLYNRAVTEFRLYDVDDNASHYDEAIQFFKSVKQPRWPRYRWLPMQQRSKVHDWLLYLLAQVGIANCLAHKLNVVSNSEKEHISNSIRDIKGSTIALLDRLRESLGPAADEVEWRIFNAETIAELYGTHDAKRGIKAARKGLRIDPDNLPLRANVGSLILLRAQQAEEQNNTEERSGSLKEAEDVFVSLKETGWDPGFVHYRLGRIKRLQGEFSQAIELLELAKNKDVANFQIESEITKAQLGNSQFDC